MRSEEKQTTSDVDSGYDYRTEIEASLDSERVMMGDVFRLKREGADVQSIAAEMKIPERRVRTRLAEIRTLQECRELTDRPTEAARRARRVRGFINRNSGRLSGQAVARLEVLAKDHERISRDEDAIARETRSAEESSTSIPEGVAGIYVYTYPHYLKCPVLPSEDEDAGSRTYLKIGLSKTDVRQRVQQQGTTALPELPVILRIYTCPDGSLSEVETRIHRHLNAVDHSPVNRRGNGVGTEWFLTHLSCVDSTAGLLGLSTEYAYQDDQL